MKQALKKGEVTTYTFGAATLHAYKTNDPLEDEVYLVETPENLVMIELPSFRDNLVEFREYVQSLKKPLTDVLVAHHPAGASYFKGAKMHFTKTTEKALLPGGGIRGLLDNFAKAFGAAFDMSVPQRGADLRPGRAKIGGVEMLITENGDGYDIGIPSIACVYTHMMGSDVHSIVAGAAHADAIIAQLEGYKAKGYRLILTSHYEPETIDRADVKIAYLKSLKAFAAESVDAAGFASKMKSAFPGYSGLNYLEMTAGMFFPRA